MKSRLSAIAATAAIAILSAGSASAFGLNSASERDRQYVASYNPSATQDDNLSLGRELPSTTRVVVADPTGEAPGTITVDTENRYLYLSMAGGRAMRYDVGVGRQGFEWGGVVHVGRKAEWPGWTPPAAMLKRRPDLPRHMAGGVDNPLGARAMYLYSGQRDVGYRIHGSNEPDTIGQAVSSGCIRMLNADVEDLYERVRVGAKVVVLR